MQEAPKMQRHEVSHSRLPQWWKGSRNQGCWASNCSLPRLLPTPWSCHCMVPSFTGSSSSSFKRSVLGRAAQVTSPWPPPAGRPVHVLTQLPGWQPQALTGQGQDPLDQGAFLHFCFSLLCLKSVRSRDGKGVTRTSIKERRALVVQRGVFRGNPLVRPP